MPAELSREELGAAWGRIADFAAAYAKHHAFTSALQTAYYDDGRNYLEAAELFGKDLMVLLTASGP